MNSADSLELDTDYGVLRYFALGTFPDGPEGRALELLSRLVLAVIRGEPYESLRERANALRELLKEGRTYEALDTALLVLRSVLQAVREGGSEESPDN